MSKKPKVLDARKRGSRPAPSQAPQPVNQPPSAAVTALFSGPSNPLVSISTVERSPLGGQQRGSRAMGFMIERFTDGLRLVVTCRHVVDQFKPFGRRPVIAFKNPLPTMLDLVGDPIEDLLAESDVAFLMVRDASDASTRPFDLTAPDPAVSTEEALYNAKNECEPVLGTYLVQIFRQGSVHEFDEVAFCKYSHPTVEIHHRDHVVIHERLCGEGWIQGRLLRMVSRPSCSGSPVWDDELRLYGMNVRGSTPQDNPGAGDQLVCLPTSALLAARLRVDAQIRQRLAAL